MPDSPAISEVPAWPADVSAADRELLTRAFLHLGRAHAPISNYRVSAALRCADGEIFCGCNIENILLGLSPCAEMVAIYCAVNAGVHKFNAVAVITDSSPPASPCGSCRQLLHSWGVSRVIMGNLAGEVRSATMQELLPLAFDLDGPRR